MILQSLQDYYRRKRAEDENSLPPYGFERKAIEFVIKLDQTGRFLGFEDLRDRDGKFLKGREFWVPQGSKRTIAVSPFLLWDNAGYVLGVDTKNKPERACKQFNAFSRKVADLVQALPDDAGLQAVHGFYERFDIRELQKDPAWEYVSQTNGNLSFQLEGDLELVCQRPQVKTMVLEQSDSAETRSGICCLTGEETRLAKLHPPIQGVSRKQSTGGSIVSFNLDAFSSFGKTQGYNSPIGVHAAFEYTTALNHLLHHESRQRISMGDMAVVFWADRADPMEGFLADYFGDNPDEGVGRIRSILKSPVTGVHAVEDDATCFFVLGIAPNAARLVVRLWEASTPARIGERILCHFDDLHLFRARDEKQSLSIALLLRSIATQGKLDNVPPRLNGEILKAILTGGPYPITLAQAALRHCRTEGVSHPRAALLKAWLIRYQKQTGSTEKEVQMALDVTNTNSGYALGRLFAVLEHLQKAAQPNIGTTIRDRFYSSASTTPGIVFPQLMRLKNHHLGKLENKGLVVWYEKLISEIMGLLDDFPAQLGLSDQGRFAIGYYHQIQNFYASKKEKTNE